MAGEGAALYQQMLDQGVSQGDADTWRAQTTQQMFHSGAAPKDMDDYWGVKKPDMAIKSISPFLWFNSEAEEAANLYVSLFPNSRITKVSRYGDAGPGPKGTIMSATFELDGQEFIGLNGGPQFQFSEAISFFVECKTQEEVDQYWDKLLAGGGQPSQCGWLKDKFGLAWQVVPEVLMELLTSKDRAQNERVMKAMMQMGKIDMVGLKRAYEQG